jgi:hypothetical protein
VVGVAARAGILCSSRLLGMIAIFGGSKISSEYGFSSTLINGRNVLAEAVRIHMRMV